MTAVLYFRPPFMRFAFPIFFLVIFSLRCSAQDSFSTTSGTLSFKSEAPQEVIKAESHNMLGKIETGKRTFAFRVLIRTFEGFNSSLQQIHFNENYLETDKFPEASFSGKIIEPVDFSQPGKIIVRAKGILKIHGMEQERIIKSEMTINGNRIHIESNFSVQLADHNIRIPRIVHEKVATEINVTVVADLTKE